MDAIALISGLSGLGVGIAFTRLFPASRKKEQLEIETLVVPPGSTVLIRIEDGLNEREVEMLRHWMDAAAHASPQTKYAVVCDALFKVQVIRPTV